MIMLKLILVISVSFSAGALFMAWWISLSKEEHETQKTVDLLADLNDLHRRASLDASYDSGGNYTREAPRKSTMGNSPRSAAPYN